jgi:manganese transport protein
MLPFFGPGYLVAVGYMDPGNWATSLAGGSRFGYTLLSVILVSNLMAMLFQAAAVRLGLRPVSTWRRLVDSTSRRVSTSRSGSSARRRSSPAIWPR